MIGSVLLKVLSIGRNLYSIVAVAILFSISIFIFKTGKVNNVEDKNIIDYKSIAYIKIDYGGGIFYNIYLGNAPVIIRRLKSYEGDILVLYLKKGSNLEIKRGDHRTDNGRTNP
ncbi:MAG: hypothetical protein QXD03_04710 [Candidatus Anstonellales archaeon]